MIPETYPLPSSPTRKVLDRFSLLSDAQPPIEEDSSGQVPLWPLLHHLLSPSTIPASNPDITAFADLTSLLDTISTTLRATSHPAGDYALLREAITSRFQSESRFFAVVWPRIARLALEMPALFPAGELPVLGGRDGETSKVALSRRQAACLVVHQFLRTLVAPGWMEEGGLCDFGVWYGREGQRQESAVRAYLGALIAYFEEVVCGGGLDSGEWVVEYALRSVEEGVFQEVLGREGCVLGEMEVVLVERYDLLPESLGIPGGAAVVSANRNIGFGQSATQEEVHVGSSPEACPAVLLTPPLKDGQVLVVRGAQVMVNITGQRRDIGVEKMPIPEGGQKAWRERTMLFMDALELDMAEAGNRLPDLLPGNIDREVRKAYTAFLSGGFSEVRTGLWGCGAFCGDPGIKMLLLWLAASMAGLRLVVVCDSTDLEFAKDLRCVAGMARDVLRDTAGLRQLLGEAPPSLLRGQSLSWIRGQLEQKPAIIGAKKTSHS